MKKLIFVGIATLVMSPAFADEKEDQGKLEIRQSQKELSAEYEKKMAIMKDPDLKYLPQFRFINAGRRR